MFKQLTTLLFILFISISLISVSPVFAGEDNPQEFIKEYEQYLRQTAADIQKTQVEIEIAIPKREGYDDFWYGSGTVIAKTTLKTENIVYFIHTCPHIVGDVEKLLEVYKEARIRISIIGKKDNKAGAEIVAWNWATEGLLLRTVIFQEQLENFKFEVAKISNRLPVSSTEEKFSDNILAEFVYAGGYPSLELADSWGKVAKYVNNDEMRPRSYSSYSFRLLKTMHIAFKGLVGSGQSGGGIFMVNDKTRKPEWVGTASLGFGQLIIAVPVDVTVSRFLKEVPDLKGLIDFPKYEFEPWFEQAKSKTVIYGEVVKEKNKRSND